MASAVPMRPKTPLAERDLLTFFFAVSLVVFLTQALNSGRLWAVGWVALGVLALVLQRRSTARFVLILELPILINLLSYSASTLYLTHERQDYDFTNDPVATQAAWVALGGLASFLAGLAVVVLRPAQRWQSEAPPVRMTPQQALVLYVIGLINMEGISRIAPVSIAAIAYTFGLCVPLSLFIYLQLAMDSERRWVGTAPFYLWLAALGLWSLRSMLGGIFGSTLLILAIFITQQIRRSYIFAIIGLTCAALLIPLIQDTKSSYRQRLASGVQASERALQTVVAENFRKTFLEGDLETYRNGLTQLAERLCTFDIWLRVKRHMELHQDFAKGGTILDALIFGFIPRIFWPDKPITGGANTLAEQYADMLIAENTSVGVGMISEFYINGGTWAVLLGMFGLGLIGGGALMRGWFDNVQPLGTMSGILAFSLLVRADSNLADVLGGFLRVLFLWGVFRFWIIRRSRRKTSVPAFAANAPLP
ncbi:MAG: hypothetical protein IT578_12475 [Verrucomicrobiae bacterium]|nr:hypothetical protein [Verrucomicrobiae bacterium]